MSRLPAYLIRPEATGCEARRIAPFGNLGIKVCLPLPRAYRSLPRPSSSCDAKASTVRPFALDRAFRFQSENTISVLMLYNLLLPAARRLRGVRLLLFIRLFGCQRSENRVIVRKRNRLFELRITELPICNL